MDNGKLTMVEAAAAAMIQMLVFLEPSLSPFS
jgi:hypothetical protein